jgi:hypothetical protein
MNSCRNLHKTAQDFPDTYVKEDEKVFLLCCGNYGNIQIFFKIGNANHYFFALILLFVKALRQLRQIWEKVKAMK